MIDEISDRRVPDITHELFAEPKVESDRAESSSIEYYASDIYSDRLNHHHVTWKILTPILSS
jgi:hypothetical protein